MQIYIALSLDLGVFFRLDRAQIDKAVERAKIYRASINVQNIDRACRLNANGTTGDKVVSHKCTHLREGEDAARRYIGEGNRAASAEVNNTNGIDGIGGDYVASSCAQDDVLRVDPVQIDRNPCFRDEIAHKVDRNIRIHASVKGANEKRCGIDRIGYKDAVDRFDCDQATWRVDGACIKDATCPECEEDRASRQITGDDAAGRVENEILRRDQLRLGDNVAVRRCKLQRRACFDDAGHIGWIGDIIHRRHEVACDDCEGIADCRRSIACEEFNIAIGGDVDAAKVESGPVAK